MCLRRAEPCSSKGHICLLTAQRMILRSVFSCLFPLQLLQAGQLYMAVWADRALHSSKGLYSHRAQ